MSEKRFYLEQSPLNTPLDLSILFEEKNNISPQSSSSVSSISSNKRNLTPLSHLIHNQNDSQKPFQQKLKQDFPLSEGRSILGDTIDSHKMRNNQTQEYVNENIKSAIKDYKIPIKVLIRDYKIGISDLKNFKIIKDINDLKILDFTILDLSIDRILFNTSHLKTLFQINFKILIQNGIKFNIFLLRKGLFTFEELQCINFDFNICFQKTEKIIDLTKDEGEKKRIFKKFQTTFKKIYTEEPQQLSYNQMVQLNLTDENLKYLKIKKKDIQEY